MKKPLNLRQWLTVPEAARHLTLLFGEDVSEADVLRFALEDHLTLSVDFVNHTMARCGPVVPIQDAKRISFPSLDNSKRIHTIKGLQISSDEVIEFDQELVRLAGIWDLKMTGAEQIDVERRFQDLTDGPSVDLYSPVGTIVCGPDGLHCQLLSHFSDDAIADPEKT